jgi:hypothetical protein
LDFPVILRRHGRGAFGVLLPIKSLVLLSGMLIGIGSLSRDAKALKRKERMVKTNVDVVLETSASEGEDRPKKKVRRKVVENKSEVEITEEPLSRT